MKKLYEEPALEVVSFEPIDAQMEEDQDPDLDVSGSDVRPW